MSTEDPSEVVAPIAASPESLCMNCESMSRELEMALACDLVGAGVSVGSCALSTSMSCARMSTKEVA